MGLFWSVPEPFDADIYVGRSLGAVLDVLRPLKKCINIVPLKEDDVYRHKPRIQCITITYNSITTCVEKIYVDSSFL